MPIKSLIYRTDMVRAWLETESDDGKRAWRLVIETPSTGERIGFSSSEAFIEALCQRLFADDMGTDMAKQP